MTVDQNLQGDALWVMSNYVEIARGTNVEPLGPAGGFSGALIWRVTASDQSYCVRRWPESYPTLEHLKSIHRTLMHVGRHGLRYIPVPLVCGGGATLVDRGGALWEVTPWMRGVADYWLNPTDNKLANAMQALARFHLASADTTTDCRQVSPGIADRRAQLEQLLSRGASTIRANLSSQAEVNLLPYAGDILAHFEQHASSVLRELQTANVWEVALQPCIRDVWHDHVLFDGEEVNGIVDFGAMRVDSPACDIARLLGSMVDDSDSKWEVGMRAYRSVRPLCDNELRLIRVFDRSTTLMSPMNWLDWIYVKKRRFSDPPVIIGRVQKSLLRMRNLSRFRHAWVPILD